VTEQSTSRRSLWVATDEGSLADQVDGSTRGTPELAKCIRELVNAAPPLSPWQRAQLHGLLVLQLTQTSGGMRESPNEAA
jgi:hypothetical protein